MLAGKGERLADRAVLHFFEGGYVGLSRVEGGRVNLAALATPRVAQRAHHDLDALLARLSRESPALAADLEGAVARCPGPSSVSEPVSPRPRTARSRATSSAWATPPASSTRTRAPGCRSRCSSARPWPRRSPVSSRGLSTPTGLRSAHLRAPPRDRGQAFLPLAPVSPVLLGRRRARASSLRRRRRSRAGRRASRGSDQRRFAAFSGPSSRPSRRALLPGLREEPRPDRLDLGEVDAIVTRVHRHDRTGSTPRPARRAGRRDPTPPRAGARGGRDSRRAPSRSRPRGRRLSRSWGRGARRMRPGR